MKKIVVVVIGLLSANVFAQTQVNGPILGGITENSGTSTSLSGDGQTVAVGYPNNSLSFARVFANSGGAWVQKGGDIMSTSNDDKNGFSVSLSEDGNTIAVGGYRYDDGNNFLAGAVQIYQFQNGTGWVQIGNTIAGIDDGDYNGYSVSLSNDGNVVAIGAPSGGTNLQGYVRVFENQSNNWVQIGNGILGNDSDQAGTSVALSGDGSTLVIGAPYNGGGAINGGSATVYENQGGNWVPIGNPIYGDTGGNVGLMTSISISESGNVVAVGSRTDDTFGTNAGSVWVYENQGGNWVLVGNAIPGLADDEFSGHSVSLSDDGTTIVVGAVYGDFDRGVARAYKNLGGNWIQLGTSLSGEQVDDYFGHSVSMAGDGSGFSVGAYGNDANGAFAGATYVYDLSEVLSQSELKSTEIVVYFNATTDRLLLKNSQWINTEITVRDNQGKLLFKGNIQSEGLDMSGMANGVYHVSLISNQGIANQKILKY